MRCDAVGGESRRMQGTRCIPSLKIRNFRIALGACKTSSGESSDHRTLNVSVELYYTPTVIVEKSVLAITPSTIYYATR
jgi:hypothetical protein